MAEGISLSGSGAPDDDLVTDIVDIIENARRAVAQTANSEMTLTYWLVGERVNRDVLGNKRAEYGRQIVSRLATQLTEAGYIGFGVRNIRRMMQFANVFPDFEIVSRLATQLSWSHFVEVLPLKDPLQREFYLVVAANSRWSRDMLRDQIDAMLYERMAISSKSEEEVSRELALLRDENRMSADLVFKDPYFLEFTGLTGHYNEKELEDVLVARLESFLLELGSGFTFVARQKRMVIDGEDFYLDLLFYHRKLHRLIAVDLKRGRFKAEYKGQMELYLRYLDRYEREEGEESPLGLLLCSEGSAEQIELLRLDEAGIRVAQYYTELPSKEVLRRYLSDQADMERGRLAHKKQG